MTGEEVFLDMIHMIIIHRHLLWRIWWGAWHSDSSHLVQHQSWAGNIASHPRRHLTCENEYLEISGHHGHFPVCLPFGPLWTVVFHCYSTLKTDGFLESLQAQEVRSHLLERPDTSVDKNFGHHWSLILTALKLNVGVMIQINGMMDFLFSYRLDYLHTCRGSMGESLYAQQRQRWEPKALSWFWLFWGSRKEQKG